MRSKQHAHTHTKKHKQKEKKKLEQSKLKCLFYRHSSKLLFYSKKSWHHSCDSTLSKSWFHTKSDFIPQIVISQCQNNDFAPSKLWFRTVKIVILYRQNSDFRPLRYWKRTVYYSVRCKDRQCTSQHRYSQHIILECQGSHTSAEKENTSL